MKSTVFCSFDHMDMADIALGRLRSEIKSIYQIDYINNAGLNRTEHPRTTIPWMGGFVNDNYANAEHRNTGGITPPRPVTVKIICNSKVRDRVISKLVNLHAYGVVTS